jgi:phenylalanyl-tRNA synthetase beta chain
MKLSLQWLREWVPVNESAEALAERMTLAGLETETAPLIGALPQGVVVGRIIAAERHPQADRLQVCQVDVGQAAPLSIVCGAANARVGLHAPCATVGGSLPGGQRITEAKLRGVDSFGMLCSTQELGLAEKSDGLLELDPESLPGTPIERHLSFDDALLHLELTPNRGDCLSVLGLARELAALYSVPMRRPNLPPAVVVGDKVLKVELDDAEACPAYVGRLITRLRTDARTPDWMRERLRRSGIRCLHPVVDITNYVMLELGQPLHAFDLKSLQGTIRVRRAAAGESLALLNEQTVALDHAELVIADDRGPLALAGVMGGAASGVNADTTAIFLESACFAPAAVAGTGRRHKLNSDALYRFERGVDPGLQRTALDRASQLIVQLCGGEVHPVSQAGRLQPEGVSIRLRAERVSRLLGIKLPPKEIEALLGRLGMSLRHDVGGSWQVKVPSYRSDLRLEVDLIEEVARLHGYARIAAEPYPARLAPRPLPENRLAAETLDDCLIQRGWQETVSLAFADPRLHAALMPDAATVRVDNPLAEPLADLRCTLWTGLIPAWRHNLQRQVRRLRLFERGVVFAPGADGVEETACIAGLASGPAAPEQWGLSARESDFHDLKAEVEALLGGRLAEARFVADAHPALHPGQTARVWLGDQAIGWLGRLHPRVVQALDLPEAPLVFELAVDPLRERPLPKARPWSEFPSSRRDLAVVVPLAVTAQALIDAARAVAGPSLIGTPVFDVYHGKGLSDGCKSIAIGLIFNDYSRTLQQTEIEAQVAAILQVWQQNLGAVVRA